MPGEINEYAIEILSTANLFKKGHRICIDITSMDLPSGLAGAHDVEYAPYHLCSSKTTVHEIYHDEQHPSYLLLPIIPQRRRKAQHRGNRHKTRNNNGANGRSVKCVHVR